MLSDKHAIYLTEDDSLASRLWPLSKPMQAWCREIAQGLRISDDLTTSSPMPRSGMAMAF
jgi:hypothetical protein